MKKKLFAASIVLAGGLLVAPAAAGAAPADGRCVAKGAGATFDGPTKSAVAKAGLMSFVITDHAFNGADGTEALLGLTICE